METKIIYELSERDFSKVIESKLNRLKADEVLGRFRDRLVSVDTVAEIHNIHRDTVIRYAQAGLLQHERQGKLYKFSLQRVLELDFHELRRQL